MRAYSSDLRIRVLAYYQTTGKSMRQVAAIFQVSKASISRWFKTTTVVNSHQTQRASKLPSVAMAISQHLSQEPLTTLKRLREWLLAKTGVKSSLSSLWRWLQKLGYTHKQSRKRTTSISNSPEQKEAFRLARRQHGYQQLLCLDEVGFGLEMCAQRGWSRRGQRCEYQGRRKGHQNYSGLFLISTQGIEAWSLSKTAINGKGSCNSWMTINNVFTITN